MANIRVASSRLLFGFGTLSIGLISVRASNHPWIVAGTFGLTTGGLHQLIWYALNRKTPCWTTNDFAFFASGGFLALALFALSGIPVPTNGILISSVILVSTAVGIVSGGKSRHHAAPPRE